MRGLILATALVIPVAASLPAAAPLPASSVILPAPALPAHGFDWTGPAQQGGWLRGHAPPGTAALALDGVPVPLTPDGAFFIAFDRDALPSASLIATRADGRRIIQPITIARRAWDIENINIARHPDALPDADYLRLRATETAQIAAARALSGPASSIGWRQSFIWPVAGRISGHFGAQRIYRGVAAAYHTGLDIATGAAGTLYMAPADGVVVLAADHPFTLEGNLLMIDHGMGLTSAFLHSSALLVHVGDHVRQGQVIGRIGMTGRATGPHLHWGLRWHDTRLDPLLFVKAP